MIHSNALPPGATPSLSDEGSRNMTTIAGTFQTHREVSLLEIILPEFDKGKRIDHVNALVFDARCNYDIILGRDFLKRAGIVMDFEKETVSWFERTIPMKHPQHWRMMNDAKFFSAEETFMDQFKIEEAKYEEISPSEVSASQKHLSVHQRNLLTRLLLKFPVLFDGKLGLYKGKKVSLEIQDDAVPYHAKAYSVPMAHAEIFRKELRHLVNIGVLRPCGPSEWAAPTFIIPKKVVDGVQRVRWLTDFRELNRVLKRKVYPLPIIQDIIQKRSGYKYLTKLDLSMMYYTFELDEVSKELCTIVTPYGKFQYCRMAMGLKPAPDICQSFIEEVLVDLDVDVYIDDIGIFTNGSYEEHLSIVEKVLLRLQDKGFKCNPSKCAWAVQETDFLGYWLTPSGIKPWKKKVEAVLKMAPPQNIHQLRSFIGAVSYYRTMWPRRSHLLAPLTALTGKGSFTWTNECQKAFEEMKAVMASDAMTAYPNHNLPFKVYTDSSDYQMGAVIMQSNRIVAYWSRKLNPAQQNYSTMEKELLAIVMCFKEYRSMLLGAQIDVYTDHKNLTFRTLNIQRVLRWRLFLEEFGPTFHYCPGKDNVLADCFSRLPRMAQPSVGKNENKGKEITFDRLPIPKGDQAVDELLHTELNIPPDEKDLHKAMPCKFSCCRNDSTLQDQEIMEVFLNHPPLTEMRNPITMLNIQQRQFEDAELNEMRNQFPYRFPIKVIQGRPVICYRAQENDDEKYWKIALPSSLSNTIIEWYHQVLGHCGINRLYDSIRAHFQVPGLKKLCTEFQCDDCQKNKVIGPGFGKLPPRHAQLLPWNEVAVDLIGPWTIVINGNEIKFHALTCIDPVTNLVEIQRLEAITAEAVGQMFENLWLSRYPRPNRCIHDNGSEFIGSEFQEVLERNGIIDVPTTSRNPQANAICERMHQTIGNVLRTTGNSRTNSLQKAMKSLDDAIATTVHATRCTVSSVLGISPGALVYQRDMFLDLPIVADLLTIRDKRQVLIDENLRRQNQKRREWTYAVGQEVLIKAVKPRKLEPKAHGPYTVVQVYTNGTLDVRRGPHVVERLNLRRLLPYRRR